MLTVEMHRGNREAIREGSYGRFLYNFYRTYDPNTGRYLEADPVGQVGGINLYEYAESTPVSASDPRGLSGGSGTRITNFVKSALGNAWPPSIRDRALTAAGALSSDPAVVDALAHCIGACEAAARWGRNLARSMLDYYEVRSANTPHPIGGVPQQMERDLAMDLHNNAVGIDKASFMCPESCEEECLAAWRKGELETEGWKGGKRIGPGATYLKLFLYNVGAFR